MANRYWVGGSGTWGLGGTANWSATSGGAGGASYPTSVDDVFFDQAATYTVSCSGTGGSSSINCRSITVSAGTVTFNSTNSGILNVYGSFTFTASPTWNVPLVFKATATGNTITTNARQINNTITFDGVGGGWTLGGALTVGTGASTAGLTFTNGTFNTGNFNVSTSNYPIFTNTSGTQVVNLGSSTLTSTYIGGPGSFTINIPAATASSLTLNAGTSTINSPTAGTGDFYGGGKTFYNVVLRCPTFYLTGTNIRGANTFNNLTIQGSSTNSINYVTLEDNQTVNGTLTLGSVQSSANGGAPMLLRSNNWSLGTNRTITAAAVSILGVTFQNITGAGAAAPFTGTNIGDGGGNTGITATAAKTVYWSLLAGGTWQVGTSGSIAFATTSGGAPSATNFPLVQDTVIIDNAGLTTGNSISCSPSNYYPNINCTRTNAFNFGGSTGTGFPAYGNVTLPSVTSVGALFNPIFGFQQSSGIKTLTLNGSLPSAQFSINCPPGSGMRLGGATSNTFSSFTAGTFELNGYTLTQTSMSTTFQSSGVRTVTAGGGNITITGNNATVFSWNGTNVTTTDTLIINLTYSGSVGTRSLLGAPYPSLAAAAQTNQTDRLFINVTAGTDIVNWAATSLASHSYGVFDFTGFSGTLTASSNSSSYMKGFTLSTGLTTSIPSSHTINLYDTGSINTNGKSIGGAIGIGYTTGVPANISANTTMASALTTTSSLLVNLGTFTTSNFNVTANTFFASASFSHTVNLGSSVVTIGQDFTAQSTTTMNAGTSTINMTNSASPKNFNGAGKTYNVVNQAGTSTLLFTGTGTSFANITASTIGTLSFSASQTFNLAAFSANGSAGNQLTIGPSTPSQYTLNYTGSGVVSKSYCTISYCNATQNIDWVAYVGNGNINNGNNTGILFYPPNGFFALNL